MSNKYSKQKQAMMMLQNNQDLIMIDYSIPNPSSNEEYGGSPMPKNLE